MSASTEPISASTRVEPASAARHLHLRTMFFIGYLLLMAYFTLAVVYSLPLPWWLLPLTTLVQWAFAIAHADRVLGRAHVLVFAAIASGVSLLFEIVGIATGLVYGAYHYTGKLGVAFLGVPLIIPLAWFMMIYPSYILARVLLGEEDMAARPRSWGIVPLSALLMTAWDLAIDPKMVGAGYWVWDVPGAFFGIPIQNYIGWFVTTLVIYSLYLGFARRRPAPPRSVVSANMVAQPLVVYAAAGASPVLVALLDPNALPASQAIGLVTIFAMAPPVLAGLLRLRQNAAR